MADLARLDVHDHHQSVALTQGCLDRRAQALRVVGIDAHAVNDQFHGVILVAVQLHAVFQFAQFAVGTHIQIALLAQVLEQILVMSLAVFDQRGEYVYLAAGVRFEDQVEDPVPGIFHHRGATEVAAGLPQPGEQQTEEVVNLGCCAHGGPWILVDGFLFDADHGAQAGDFVDIGAFHRTEHIAGI